MMILEHYIKTDAGYRGDLMEEKILIVDNNKIFLDGLKYSLEQDGHIIDVLQEGKEVLNRINKKSYNLILLELDLPDTRGIDICKAIREVSYTPIIIITENNNDITKVSALEYGADDYLVKPFNILELKARIKAIFRRIEYSMEDNSNHILQYKDFTINSLKRKINLQDKDIDLTGKEFDLFYTLSSNPGKIFTREELLEQVWGYEYYGDLRTVDVHIRRIREKIEDDYRDNQYIMTKWGVGYYFNNI